MNITQIKTMAVEAADRVTKAANLPTYSDLLRQLNELTTASEMLMASAETVALMRKLTGDKK